MIAWQECKLGDLLVVKHGFAFLGEYFANEGSHIVLTPGNFFDNGGFKRKEGKEKWYRGNIPSEYILGKGDLVVAMTEQAEGLLGSAAIIPASGLYLHNQRIGLVLPRDAGVVDKAYAYYLFNSQQVRQQIRASASGTKIRHTAPSRIADVEVSLPSLPIQKRIAGILSAYDDLIENSQRRIKILEEMARRLYREWFVHFRFPGHEACRFVDSSLGEIPEGWEVKPLGEIAEDVRRNVPKGKTSESKAYVGLEHIPRRSLALDAWEQVTELGSNKLAFNKGEILFGKIRPYFHKVSVAPFDGICSADTIVIRSISERDYAFMVACVSSDEFVAEASASANGAKMPRANWDVLKRFPVVIPRSGNITEQFSGLLIDILSQQQTLVFQIQNLRRTRDLLLPRLLSGQIDVEAVPELGNTANSLPFSAEVLG